MMNATKLPKDFMENPTCEQCGQERGIWGVVPTELIKELQEEADFSNREAILLLLEEYEDGITAIGSILCTNCLKKRIKVIILPPSCRKKTVLPS